MAVVRDYLITQFTFYGLSVFANQMQRVSNLISESAINSQLEKANISSALFNTKLDFIRGNFSAISRQARQLNNEFQNIRNVANSLQGLISNIPRNLYPQQAQGSINRLTNNAQRIQRLANEAAASLASGNFDRARRKIESLNTAIEQSNRSLIRLLRYSTPGVLGNLAPRIQQQIATISAEFTNFNQRISSMNLQRINSQTQNTIINISRFADILKSLILPTILGFAASAVASFFMVSRVIYNVTENIRDAYRVAVDLGVSLQGAFGLTRSLRMFGFDVNVISQASMKLSEAITKNQLAGRLMLGWLGLSPYQMQGMDTLEAIDTVLDKIMKLPSVSLRKTIGKELLGERFPELLMMKELGYLDTIRQLNSRYTEDYIKKTMEVAKAWAVVKMNIQDIGINLANNVLPLVNKLVVFTNFIVENSAILFTLITALGAVLTIAKKPMLGIPLVFLGITGLLSSFKSESNANLSTIAEELRAQTRIMDLQYRTLNTIRLQLNQFIATTTRQTPNLYQASIYRSLLTNTGGI